MVQVVELAAQESDVEAVVTCFKSFGKCIEDVITIFGVNFTEGS